MLRRCGYRILLCTMAHDDGDSAVAARAPGAVTMPSPIGRLAERAAELDLAHVPSDVREHAATIFADTIAVIAAGARQVEVQRLTASTDPMFPGPPTGPCTVLTPQLLGTDATTAAYLNGTAGRRAR